MVPKRCGARSCALCAKSKAREWRARIGADLAQLHDLGRRERRSQGYYKDHRARFVTLTVKNGDNLEERFGHLQDGFSKLRRSKLWDALEIDYYVGFYEVTNEGAGWHPHLHLVVFSRWIRQAALSEVWHAISGDSMIVDIQLVRSNVDAFCDELVKYVAKPVDARSWSWEQRDEFEEALRRKRTVVRFDDLDLDRPAPGSGSWTGPCCPTCGLEESMVFVGVKRTPRDLEPRWSADW